MGMMEIAKNNNNMRVFNFKYRPPLYKANNNILCLQTKVYHQCKM
jgi:hypothetical protein